MAQELTNENFQKEVLESTVPVLVDFWSAGCGPCRKIAPIIEQLAAEADGKFRVGKVDAYDQPDLTAQYRISALPTLLFFKQGKVASSSSDKSIKLWDVEKSKEKATLKGHTEYVFAVAFTPDGKTLATGSADKTIKLWDVEKSKEKATLKGHTEYVESVAFSPDGKTLASGTRDKTIKLWDVASEKEKATGKVKTTLGRHDNPVCSVAFSPDGKTLANSLVGSQEKHTLLKALGQLA